MHKLSMLIIALARDVVFGNIFQKLVHKDYMTYKTKFVLIVEKQFLV